MKNELYKLWYAKGISWAEVTLNSGKIKFVALAVIEFTVVPTLVEYFLYISSC